MQSDIKLKPGQVQIDAWDLLMDTPSRRKIKSGHRRALVHDFSDGLTVNYHSDYPGGLTLKGVKVIEGNKTYKPHAGGLRIAARIIDCRTTDLIIDGPGRRKAGARSKYRRALVHDAGDKLTINFANDYPSGVKINGAVGMPGSLAINGSLKLGTRSTQIDVMAEIKALKKEIMLLKAKLAKT